MRKETINTFTDGMSLDLNPLGTPAKTLTNCLNGTLVTYNGNELTLQNDMGNAEVGTAYLPKGYVPVGMKEHGGIIYVASYNPKTNKGLLGCFPSPQLIYTSETAQSTMEVNILETFITLIENIVTGLTLPIINFTEYKEEIFKDSNTQEPRIFNSGDTFIIKTNTEISQEIREAIDKNIIVFKLYILPIDGGEPIDISDCSRNDLREYLDTTNWEKKLWIFLNVAGMYTDIETPILFEKLINDYRGYLQTYPPNIGQGTLQFAVEFNTFSLFNLYKKYKFNKEEEDLSVKFIGTATPDTKDPCHPVKEEDLIQLNLFGSIDYERHKNVEEFENLTTYYKENTLWAETDYWPIYNELYYDIVPGSKYGILKLKNNSFLKSGKLSYQDIIDNKNTINRWDFEINSSEAIIKWSFDWLEEDKDIDYVRFTFIPFDKLLDNENHVLSKEEILNMYTDHPELYGNVFDIRKEFYSGDFEDSFPFTEEYLKKNYIYLCRFDIIYTNGNIDLGVDYKLLYTATFFNDKDISEYNNNNRPKVTLTLNAEIKLISNPVYFKYIKILGNKDNSEISKIDLGYSMTANDILLLGDDELWEGRIIGIIVQITYANKSTINISGCSKALYENKTYKMESFAGNLDSEEILDHQAANISGEKQIKFLLVSDTDFTYTGNEELEHIIKENIEEEYVDYKKVGDECSIIFYKGSNGEYTTKQVDVLVNRGIVGKYGAADEKFVVHEGLFPVYDEDDENYNEHLLGFKLSEDDNLENVIGCNSNALSRYWMDNSNIDYYTGSDPWYSPNAMIQGLYLNLDAPNPYLTSLEEAVRQMGDKPINVVVSNGHQRIKNIRNDDSPGWAHNYPIMYYSNILVENDNGKSDRVDNFSDMFNVPTDFYTFDYVSNAVSILWRTQNGHRLMNIATPINVESTSLEEKPIYLRASEFERKKTFYTANGNLKVPVADTHLRAEKMLICMLSLILIAKCRNSTLSLNSPEDIIQTGTFNNRIKVTKDLVFLVALTINGKNIETIIKAILSNGTLKEKDNFLPNFFAKHLEGTLLFGKDYKLNSDKLGLVNLTSIFENTDYPYFSTITDAQRVSIYPGIIKGIKDKYICQLEKDELGIYKINDVLLHEKENPIEGIDQLDYRENYKFYRIFLPTVHDLTNTEDGKCSYKNLSSYKTILEGVAYDDVLIPLTKILELRGKPIEHLRSLDSDNPLFNLLYFTECTLHKYAIPNSRPWPLNPKYVFDKFGNKIPYYYGDQTKFVYEHDVHEKEYSKCGAGVVSIFGDESCWLVSDLYKRSLLHFDSKYDPYKRDPKVDLGLTPLIDFNEWTNASGINTYTNENNNEEDDSE